MSLPFSPRRALSGQMLSALETRLVDYYRQPPVSYYATADRAAERYLPEEQPFHCDLVARVEPGWRVLEVGCGTAHLGTQIAARGATYTGLDHSPELLAENRGRLPGARFFPLDEAPAETFDLVASLYTIEHVVDPEAYLARLWSFCRPGGLVAVICPEFIDSPGLPPSVIYGRTARRLAEKLRHFAFADAAAHLLDLHWRGPRWKAAAQARPPGAFWINLRPRVLHGAPYTIDADAVHFPRLADLEDWFRRQGAAIVETSRTLPIPNPETRLFNCYLVARRPTEDAVPDPL